MEATTAPGAPPPRTKGDKAQRRGNFYTTDENDWLTAHYNKDKTPAQCAEHLGRPLSAVYVHVAWLRKGGYPIAFGRGGRPARGVLPAWTDGRKLKTGGGRRDAA
jgi:hypothetical protein